MHNYNLWVKFLKLKKEVDKWCVFRGQKELCVPDANRIHPKFHILLLQVFAIIIIHACKGLLVLAMCLMKGCVCGYNGLSSIWSLTTGFSHSPLAHSHSLQLHQAVCHCCHLSDKWVHFSDSHRRQLISTVEVLVKLQTQSPDSLPGRLRPQ